MRGSTFADVRAGSCTPRFILVSDLDHTMVQNEDMTHKHLLEFGRVWSAGFAHDSLLVYSTGRSPALFQELWNEAPLLTPDIVICSVGTEVFYRDSDGKYRPDTQWRLQLDAGGRWDRDKVQQVAQGYAHLALQQASEQRPHKLSYHLDKAAVGDPEAYLQQLAAALAAVGLGVNVVYSGGRDVDLLALGADKGRALAFLLQQIPAGCQPPLGCQVNGDSGNDVALFEVEDVRGCVVANAHPELQAWHANNANSARVLLASEPCAGGILQALRYFGTVGSSEDGGSRRSVMDCIAQLLDPSQQEQGADVSAAPLLAHSCTLLSSTTGYVATTAGARAIHVGALHAAVADAGQGEAGTAGLNPAAPGSSSGSSQVMWLDQFSMQLLPGDVAAVAAVVCSMNAAGTSRGSGSVACSVVLQRGAAGGRAWHVVQLHWHRLPAAQPEFVL